jgi:hypothetical protein
MWRKNVERRARPVKKTGGTKDDGKNKVGVREGDEITKVNLEKSGGGRQMREGFNPHTTARRAEDALPLFFPAALGLLAY